jgi:hypothetical protein
MSLAAAGRVFDLAAVRTEIIPTPREGYSFGTADAGGVILCRLVHREKESSQWR